MMEQFLIEYYEVIIIIMLATTTGVSNTINQSKLEVNACDYSSVKRGRNEYGQVEIG